MAISDTTADAEQMQIAVLQSQTTSQRLALTLALSNTAIGLSRRAIQRANPELSKDELNCTFVALHYGEHLAKAVRQYLDDQQNDLTK